MAIYKNNPTQSFISNLHVLIVLYKRHQGWVFIDRDEVIQDDTSRMRLANQSIPFLTHLPTRESIECP